jgi:hypothetical protein
MKRTKHHKSRGKSQKKTETKAKHTFDNDHARLATLTMIPLPVRGNVHARLEAPAKQAEIDLDIPKRDRDVVPVLTARMCLVKVMMPMAAPDKTRARPATLTNTPLNLLGNILVIPTKVLIPTIKLTRDITSSTACPGVPGQRPRHASGSDCVSLAMIAMK